VEKLPFLRRSLLGLLGSALGLVWMVSLGRSDELSTGASASGLVIHGAEETLRDYCRARDGALWLELPGGERWELITSTSDPQIANSGDGAFHPFDEAQVRAALSEVRFPLSTLSAHVFVLPYPRRSGLDSAAGPRLILLSPGVLPLSAESQHAELVHELGHVVQYLHMPDVDLTAWMRYRELRGITDPRYCATAPHADRPHEIFAEDFRALFGGALATRSGSIENSSLVLPQRVAGLEAFLFELSGHPLPEPTLFAFPNPARGGIAFRRGGAEPRTLDLFDLAGRRIATVEPTRTPGGWSWSWDGRGGRGEALGAGVVLARLRGAGEPALRLTLLR
jgi:hypothetical protein